MLAELKQEQLSFLIIGGETDAGGIRIVSDGKGGFKIIKVPGWNPEQMLELGSAIRVAASAARIKNPEVSRAVLNAVGKLTLSELAPALKSLEDVGHVVVVVAH
jgi:hypothetical protein